MPSKSPAQAKLMRAVAHGWKPDRMKGPPRKVAKEFVAADKKTKGYQLGGMAKRLLGEARDKRTDEQKMVDKYGIEPLTINQAMDRGGYDAVNQLQRHGWTQLGKTWVPPQATLNAPSTGYESPAGGGLAEATIQPIDEGRQFISGPSPKQLAAPAAPVVPQRTAADVAPGFQPGRVPPALVQYLASLQPPAQEEPVPMQHGGMLNFLNKGRMPGGGAPYRGVPPGAAQNFLQEGNVPRGGGGRYGPMGKAMGQAMQKLQQRGRAGAPQPAGRGPQRMPQPAPGAGVPLRGVGRPPGMGVPGAGGPTRTTQPVGGGQFSPGLGGEGGGQGITFGERDPSGGGGGFGGGAPPNLRGMMQKMQMMKRQQQSQGSPRIGSGDQQGALARATQVQTGRPPISRRQPFPGQGGQSRFGGRRRGRFR